jgi:hypothetical protein
MAKKSPPADTLALPDLLQSYEQVLETLARVTKVGQQLADMMARGETMSPASLADYQQQLTNVEAHRQVLQQRVLTFWQMIGGGEKAH